MFVNRIVSVIALCVSITAFTFLAMVGSSFDYYSYIDDYFAMILITALQTVYVMKDKTNIFKANRKNYLIFIGQIWLVWSVVEHLLTTNHITYDMIIRTVIMTLTFSIFTALTASKIFGFKEAITDILYYLSLALCIICMFSNITNSFLCTIIVLLNGVVTIQQHFESYPESYILSDEEDEDDAY